MIGAPGHGLCGIEERARQVGQRVVGAGSHGSDAGQHHRFPGTGEHGRGVEVRLGPEDLRRLDCGRHRRQADRVIQRFCLGNVGVRGEVDGPGTLRRRQPQCLAHDGCDAARLDTACPLRDGCEQPVVVDGLVGEVRLSGAPDLTADGHHGHAVEIGGGDAVGQVDLREPTVMLEGRRPVTGRRCLGDPQLHAMELAAVGAGRLLRVRHPVPGGHQVELPRFDELLAAEAVAVEDLASLVDALGTTGATIEQGVPIEQIFFTVPGQIVKVNGADVQVFEYESAEAMETEASQVVIDGSSIGTTMVSWVDTPHFFRSGRIIVLYVGSDEAVLDLLEQSIGPQFAGR